MALLLAFSFVVPVSSRRAALGDPIDGAGRWAGSTDAEVECRPRGRAFPVTRIVFVFACIVRADVAQELRPTYADTPVARKEAAGRRPVVQPKGSTSHRPRDRVGMVSKF